jgi:acyl-CoA thioester hydrolase
MPPKDRVVTETSFYVRYAETDAMRIVHHASYVVYFEEGRSDYLRQQGADYADFEKDGFYLAVSEVHARYLRAAVYGQRLVVRCWIAELGSRGMTYEYEIVDSKTGDVHVTGQTKHICITKEGQVARIPAGWREWKYKLDPEE